jgi:hypothetical protein
VEHWKSSGVPSQPGTQGASGYLGFRFVGSDVYSFEQPDLTFVGFRPQFSEMKLLGLGGAHIMTIFNNIDNWHWPCLHCEWIGSSASAHEHSNSWVAYAADKVVCVQNTHSFSCCRRIMCYSHTWQSWEIWLWASVSCSGRVRIEKQSSSQENCPGFARLQANSYVLVQEQSTWFLQPGIRLSCDPKSI